ncbi:phosphatidate phosphatase App1 family protein [Aspergillus saccharolyticus JOP 1030-1]|uniref:Actin patch protein 1 n=1 Tax=Aspergillus saccharolyticus JOP 1030-1 TaxID=1450539 RepID=A0A318ZPE7_9EURO|nr:actin patch protein 1 [Aspergillus saccharolyticus JOP 1030-1]PYH49491.1 actin patch protein 1 [Aspergillus saccharolyticus JOP 1030-1]
MLDDTSSIEIFLSRHLPQKRALRAGQGKPIASRLPPSLRRNSNNNRPPLPTPPPPPPSFRLLSRGHSFLKRRLSSSPYSRLWTLLLGPHSLRRAQLRLWTLRHETLPALRHRAQARIYRAIVRRQQARALRRLQRRRPRLGGFLRGFGGGSKSSGGGVLGYLLGRGRRFRFGLLDHPRVAAGRGSGSGSGSASRKGIGEGASVSAAATTTTPMSQYESSTSSSGAWQGTRRKKVYDYLKAANELRQTYAAQWAAQLNGQQRGYNDEYFAGDAPGAFPDVEIARSGLEEMVIFPSYGRRIVRNRSRQEDREDALPGARRGSNATIDEYRGLSDRSDTKAQTVAGLDDYEDKNAVVTVDVRGWLYAPHRGPMTRKHRLMIALARKLSGVPAPANNTGGSGDDVGGVQQKTDRREDELVDTEAQSIIKGAEGRADPAWKESALEERGDNPDLPGRPLQRTGTSSSVATTATTQMTKDELSMANAHLMERLRPFLTNPVTDMPVTVFFFDENRSQSRSIMTNVSGHFNMRAALPFVPTHIRVLASENLSVVKEVQIIEPSGVSLISDIDDTVKHSAIASGAKEIFRNTFIRELADLTIEGVADWYNQLVKMGVEIHYVSNAPWQLYPLLERYFKQVGLPPGSIHLKQYSGMLQGIFEPTAERKKGNLEQILKDFPSRKFILVGDSGEADLEVYTDIVLANPGRILGIFIRDVTTPKKKEFFEKSVDYLEHKPSRTRSDPQLVDESDLAGNRPALPPRRPLAPPHPSSDAISLDNGDLIDLRDNDEREASLRESKTPSVSPAGRTPPAKPSKPSSLRSNSTNPDTSVGGLIKRKPVPPLPPRRASTKPEVSPDRNVGAADSSTVQQLPTRPKTAGVDQDPDDARSARSRQPAPPPPPPRRANTAASVASSASSQQPSRPTSQEQQQQSYPAAAASAALQYASERLNWSASPSSILRTTQSNSSLSRTNTGALDRSGGGSENAYPPPPAAPLPNKREEMWRRRWERAQELLEPQGVVLGSWRVGRDAQDVSVWLVQEAMKETGGKQG